MHEAKPSALYATKNPYEFISIKTHGPATVLYKCFSASGDL